MQADRQSNQTSLGGPVSCPEPPGSKAGAHWHPEVNRQGLFADPGHNQGDKIVVTQAIVDVLCNRAGHLDLGRSGTLLCVAPNRPSVNAIARPVLAYATIA